MHRGLISICSICVLIACGEWLHAFSEITFDNSGDSVTSYIALNKNLILRSKNDNRNRNKPLYSPNYKLFEDYIHLVSRNCYDFFTTRNNLSPSEVKLLCRQSFKNKLHGGNGMIKQTEATRRRNPLLLKQNKQFRLIGKDEDIRPQMIGEIYLISDRNMTNTDIINPNNKSSFLPKDGVVEMSELFPEFQDLGRNIASILPKSKRRSPCRMDAPLTIDENQPLPWECFQRRRWRTLHGNVYPDRIYETVCEGSCMNGHYNCTPVKYTTHVVQFCSNGQCSDERTPSIYRNVWRFLDLEVTVGCACTR